ncbi:MAG: hypothetical protein IKM59_04855, partial [Oscillospiraceae bacterium]|nr:hypothetical protein [Oscillospiraceae bacterium]
MKNIHRFWALLLTLVILLSVVPTEVLAAATYSAPTADPEELVIDYGKSVQIELENLKKHIHLNGGATAPTLQGVVIGTEYDNGQLLSSKPSTIGCTSANTSMSATFGTVQRTSTHLNYTPTKFLTGIDRFYAVYSFTGYSKFLLVEVRIIPAAQVYYEAEDFVNTQITTMNTTDGGTTNLGWDADATDGTTPDTTQTFDQVGNADFDLTIDYKHIPMGAFFADFDGTGYDQRYSSDPIYGGNNFDSERCWMGSKGQPTDYVELVPGHLVIPTTSKEYHYVQTTVTDQYGESNPLSFVPTQNDFLEVRFRTEGVKEKYVPTDPTELSEPRLQMKLGTDRTQTPTSKNVGGEAYYV